MDQTTEPRTWLSHRSPLDWIYWASSLSVLIPAATVS